MLRRGLLLAVSISALSGCVSAVSGDMRAEEARAAQAVSAATSADTASAEAATGDPMVAAGNGEETENDATARTQADMAGVVMQQTALNAGQSSIFSTNGAAAQPLAAQTGAKPAVASIYGGGAAQSGDRLPLEDMPFPDPASGSNAFVPSGDEEAYAVPDRVPLPKSGRTALMAESAAGNATELALVAEPDLAAPDIAGQDEAEQAPADKGRKPLTLAALFAAKRNKAGNQFDGDRFAEKPKRVINRDTVSQTRRASLGVESLPGVVSPSSNAMFSTSKNAEAEIDGEDDENGFTEVASLAGLARLAPNGLWLQTEKVKTGCFKPELLTVLKAVEKHYDKPIIVTSGLRTAKGNRARQSLHTQCAAADIQITGVSKWELAEYLRSMPGRGGVGTYCHTESVHIDIGPERDWNWRCRRKKG